MWLLGETELAALRLSLAVAVRSVAISLLPAVVMAWLLTRRRFPGRTLLDAVVHLPLVLPPVVVGYLLLLLLGTRGPIGGWLDRHVRRAAGVHHAGRRGGHRGDVVSADGARDAHRARERGPRPGGRRAHAGRRRLAPLRHHHAAADAAGRAGRRGHRLRGRPRRVRRGHHLRVQHSRARRARCRWRCTPRCSRPTAMRWRRGWRRCRSRSACAGCWLSELLARGLRRWLGAADARGRRPACSAAASRSTRIQRADARRHRAVRPLRLRQDARWST